MFWKETPDYQNVLGNSFPWGPAAQKCIKRHMKSTKRKHDASTACSPTHHQQDDDPPPRPRPRPWHVLKEAEADELKMRHSCFYMYLSLSLSLLSICMCITSMYTVLLEPRMPERDWRDTGWGLPCTTNKASSTSHCAHVYKQ